MEYAVAWHTRDGVYARVGDGQGGWGPLTPVAREGRPLRVLATRSGARVFYRTVPPTQIGGDRVERVDVDRRGRAGPARTVARGLAAYEKVEVSAKAGCTRSAPPGAEPLGPQ
jgi:hypothetical protein